MIEVVERSVMVIVELGSVAANTEGPQVNSVYLASSKEETALN